jgi:hypothetical protein
MTRGLDQQSTTAGFVIPRSAAQPQHGQKSAKPATPPREPRSFQPRPGH